MGGVIEISDFEGSTIHEMINFIYTDAIENEYSVDMDLLLIAHKYEIKELEAFCEDILIRELTVDNVYDAWQSAGLLSSDKIIAACREFFRQHWLEVEKTDWHAALKEEEKDVLMKS